MDFLFPSKRHTVALATETSCTWRKKRRMPNQEDIHYVH